VVLLAALVPAASARHVAFPTPTDEPVTPTGTLDSVAIPDLQLASGSFAGPTSGGLPVP
jgi:hypothetical protein